VFGQNVTEHNPAPSPPGHPPPERSSDLNDIHHRYSPAPPPERTASLPRPQLSNGVVDPEAGHRSGPSHTAPRCGITEQNDRPALLSPGAAIAPHWVGDRRRRPHCAPRAPPTRGLAQTDPLSVWCLRRPALCCCSRRPRARRDATQSPVSDLLQARTQEQHSAPALSLYLTHFRTTHNLNFAHTRASRARREICIKYRRRVGGKGLILSFDPGMHF
jgi:hypothetical protein